MITHIKNIIGKAQKGGYAVGAFNTSNLEVTQGIIRAAAKSKSPVIIQMSESTIKYAGLETIMAIIKTTVEREAQDIPVALHLDHGKDPKIFKACVDAGFSSVHMDASEFEFKKNIAITARAVKYGHSRGAWVQGELGALFGKEGMTKIKLPKDDDYMTDPEKVKEFILKTKVDTLAISVGTMHGSFAGREKIDFKRLTKIHKNVKTPLVLHGASGVKNGEIKKSIKYGVRIINIDTELRIAFTNTLIGSIKKIKSSYDPRKVLAPSIMAVQRAVEKKMNILGSIKRK